MLTHEAYIHKVRNIGLSRIPSDDPRHGYIANTKLVYGAGERGKLRGVTYYEAWQQGQRKADFVEICATGEESPVQLAGTTLHELGHVYAGYGSGHNQAWLAACRVLGLRNIRAAGTRYLFANFTPDIREQVYNLALQLADGKPGFRESLLIGLPLSATIGACPMGIGARGGKSRGAGSGSRLVLYTCQCKPAVKVRAAKGAGFDATCNRCHELFMSDDERANKVQNS